MSNAERMRRLLVTFNDSGVEAIIDVFAPDVVWVSPPEWVDQATYEGHEGIRQLAAVWDQTFDGYTLDARNIEERDDLVLTEIIQCGAIHGSTQMVNTEAGWVARFEDGMITRVESFFSWDEIRAAFARQ